MNMLYCIYHEKMVRAEESTDTGLIHCNVVDVPLPPFCDLYCCEFPLGWAVAPPPVFDMDEFMQTVVEPFPEDETWDELYSVYENEPCRICGELISKASDAVYAGYSIDNKSRCAHTVCWNKKIPQSQWAYPESSTD